MADFRPGAWRCAKCKLRIVKTAFYASSGTLGPDDAPEQCLNGCGPMWRVTWKDECLEAERWGEEQFDRLHAALAAVAATPPSPPPGVQQPAHAQPDEREALRELISTFRLSNWTDWMGDGLPLVDRITSGDSIGPGMEQIELLADEIAAFYAERALLADGITKEPKA